MSWLASTKFYLCYDGYGYYFISRDKPTNHVAVFYDEDAAQKTADFLSDGAGPKPPGPNAVREAKLVQRINGLPHGWLPEVGYVKNVTFDAAEEQLVLAALASVQS